MAPKIDELVFGVALILNSLRWNINWDWLFGKCFLLSSKIGIINHINYAAEIALVTGSISEVLFVFSYKLTLLLSKVM